MKSRSPFQLKLASAVLTLLALFLAATGRAQEKEPTLGLKVAADFLALHVTGTAPLGTTALQYRFSQSGKISDGAPWVPAPVSLGTDGPFNLDLPLEASRWSEVQLRALKGDEVLARQEAQHRPRALRLLAPERVAALPESEREAWSAYLKQSAERTDKEYDVLAAECRQLGMAHSKPAPSRRGEFEISRGTKESWFAGEEAKRLADTVISYQTPSGGWSKAVDYSAGNRQRGTHWTPGDGEGWHYCGTLDNRSTTEQIRFLAQVHAATGREDTRAAALRGVEWLFAAQYPNGGWPQNYPIEPGYSEAITLNDDAMLHAMELLLSIAEAEAPFAFADEALRHRAQAAVERAISCLAAAQIKVDGKRAVWCAQHDPLTLAPVAARKFEPASLSGGESADVLTFLMRRGPVTPTITAVVEAAVSWLQSHRVTGLRKTTKADGKTDYVADATSEEVYWARFYDLETGKPLFVGRDQISYPTFSEMAAHNEVGYDYFTTRPGSVIEKEVARWRERAGKSAERAPKATLERNADRIFVALDGSGDFRSVQAAVDFAESHREKPVVIFIRKGRYEELVRVSREKRHVHFVGEDRKGTVITFTNNDKLRPGGLQRNVLTVEGDDFVLENLTVQNTTPYKGSQAEAIYVNAERCVLRNADFLSFQDTLNLSGRVYVRDCYVEGDVDYVWGSGAAVFERCELRSMHDGYIVQSRNRASSVGYIFLDCKLTAAPDAKKVWLARVDAARFPDSHVAFIRCAMGDHIRPAGWLVNDSPVETLRFQEFETTNLDGKPLDLSQRVHGKKLTPADAADLTAAKLLRGSDGWNPNP